MRCSKEQLLRQCRRLIRELAFKEKINENPIEAVQYLQSKLSEVFDHNNPEEREMVSFEFLVLKITNTFYLISFNFWHHASSAIQRLPTKSLPALKQKKTQVSTPREQKFTTF